MRRRCAYFGNPWIGMFMKTNDNLTFIPVDATHKLEEAVKENLHTEVKRVSLASSNLIGAYVAMNSSGAILPNICGNEDMDVFKSAGLNVYRASETANAHGNNISVNDKGGLINPHVSKKERMLMQDVLGVELVPMYIARFATVGSSCLAGNNGFLVHYSASEEEIKKINEALKVSGERGTVNMGTGFVSFGIVANKHGYVAGEASSAFELGRAESALGYV